MSDTEQRGTRTVEWRLSAVTSPRLADPVPVVTAEDIPYITDANRFQNLSVYLPWTPETSALVGTPAESLPGVEPGRPRIQVHVHGGAWRDPRLTARSIEPTVAHAFSGTGRSAPIAAIASLNYTLSRFPTHPALPYDPIKDNHTDPSREAVHPQHVSDFLHGLALLRSFGLTDGSYVLSGHSCGACLSFQSILRPPRHYGLDHLPAAPIPAALIGLNGLYDLPELVTATGLGESHAHLRDDYEMFLSNAFGADQRAWPAASPARFDPAEVAEQVREGNAPRLVVLEQSAEDQLVPTRQRELLTAKLSEVDGLRVVEGNRCTGKHAAPWEQGDMIWESVQDVLRLLQQED